MSASLPTSMLPMRRVHQRGLGAVDSRHFEPGLRRHDARIDPGLLVAAASEPDFLRHVDDAGARMVGADRDVDAERHQLGQLALHEIAVAVVQAGARRADERRLAPRQDRDLGRLEPAGVDDQHALVDHAEGFQPLDLGHPGPGDAGVVGGIAEAGVGLQQRAVAVGEPLEAGDQFIGGVVEAAERGAGAEPGMPGLGVARQHRRGTLHRDLGRFRSCAPAGCRAPIW